MDEEEAKIAGAGDEVEEQELLLKHVSSEHLIKLMNYCLSSTDITTAV